MFYYHTFKDLGILGIYDHEPLLPKYHFPEDGYWIGKKVFDVGCASGFFSKYFAERGADVTAIDINIEMINFIKEKTKLFNINTIEMDVFDVVFENKFDFVFCGSLLMHVIYPMKLLKIIHKSLKIDGLFILCSGGIISSDNVIRIEKNLGREKSLVEKEIKSSNESLWWLSPSAGNIMLSNTGFKNNKMVDSFNLTSTPYGIEMCHNYSSLHHVWNSNK